ncbi:putative disease resistance protein RGA1 [Carya illinoinensis]|uniref:putative disease resistance protein RGA1 n=1 Tax=Carya illinoinensis TaxID=32201 RepID=UPI001C71DD4A|nr:putative disease resistance protein RGA1 [Carya illinoinensis]XP_042959091.1 putative disease resistance protein RGA1 [Carya illinoinensis]
MINLGVCEAIFSSLKSLRVLDLHGKGLHIVLSSICKLKHLRYLDLSWNYQIEKLPDSITRLPNLHTLRLSYCNGLKELPRGITKLVNLRHRYNDGCENLTYMPRGLGQLTGLQTLSKFVVHFDSAPKDGGRLSELNRLYSIRLGELKISELRHGEDVAKDANLKKNEHLQVLRLRWSTKNVDAQDEKASEGLEPLPNLKKLYIDYYGGVRVPMWLLSLANLIHLSLGNCRKLKYLQPSSRLRSLKSLYLNCPDEMEYVSDCSDNNDFSSSSSSALIEFFPSLEVIRLQWCPNLKGWWRTSDSSLLPSFPRLSNLTIRESLC